jgi:hypothetical protein
MFFNLTSALCGTISQRILKRLLQTCSARYSTFGYQHGMVQNHAPDPRSGDVSEAIKLLADSVLEEGGFVIPERFVDSVDKTGLHFGAAILR